jgi:hypothetical protein
MAKILLIDFDPADRDQLAAEGYDVELKSTGWRTGSDEPLTIPEDSEAVFYSVGTPEAEARPELHAEVKGLLARRVENGARVVCFVGGGPAFRLTNIVGPVSGLSLDDPARAEAVLFNPRALFHVPFERFKPYVAGALKLTSQPVAEGVWEAETPTNGRYEFLAKSPDGYPLALLRKNGRGYTLLLPSFGPKNVEVIDYILKDKLSFADEDASGGGPDWLESEDYVFPEIRVLLAKREEERQRHEQALAEIERQVREAKAGGQEAFQSLLTAEGDRLKRAVVAAFRYLGWGKVVDVDDYWKKVIRNKEEDVWLIEPEGAAVEASLRKEELLLILVRGNKNWATDDECALLQKFKGRRMQEFDNTKMKAVLVGNYYSGTDPKARANPFSAEQAEEARKDGNGLLATYELFRALKAEKENRISKGAIRAQIREKTGVITLDI